MLEFIPFKTETDYDEFSQLAFNPQVMEMNFGRVFTPQEAQGFFQGMLSMNQSQTRLPGYCKVLLHKDEDLGGETALSQNNEPRFIGMCGMNWNEEYSAVEIEYMLLPQFWHQGLGKAVVGKMMDLLEALPADKNGETPKRVIAITDPGNLASEKILEYYGFVCQTTYTVEDGSMARLYLYT